MTALSRIVRERKIRPTQLALELGVTRAAVSMRLKNGIRTITVARRYARILKCDPTFLLD